MEEQKLYQLMYYKLSHAAEEAIRLLTTAQQECDKMFSEHTHAEIEKDLAELGQTEALRKRLMSFADAACFMDAQTLRFFCDSLQAAFQAAQQMSAESGPGTEA